jgi:DNA repair protein RadC
MENVMDLSVLNRVSEVELVYKSKVKPSERPQIKTSRDSYQLLFKNWDSNRIEFIEQFKVILMNRANKVLGIYELSTGGVTGTVADIKLVFMAALKTNACSLILSHNHPSGNLKPSMADEELTRKMKAAGTVLEIKVLDHVIVTTEGYFCSVRNELYK